MNWTDQYIGIPFLCDGRTRSGLDCGGLAMLAYREQLGIALPDYLGTLTDLSEVGLKRASANISAELSRWVPVSIAQPFDIISFRKSAIESCHVGIACSRTEMLHIIYGINACVEEFTGLKWGRKISGIYRYAA